MDQTLYARSDLDECTIVGHHHNLTLHVVAYLQVRIQSIPRMRSQLLQTESNTLLLVVEIQDNHVDLLIQFHNFVRIVYAAPRQVGNVDQTVYATQVDEYTIAGDVLDGTFQYLALLQLADDFLLLLLQLGLDESLVADNNILVLLIDFHNLEFHGLTHENIIVTNRFNVNLAAGQEGLDAKHVNNHTALSAALNESLNDFFILQSLVDTIPRTACTSLLVRENQLTLLVLLVLDVNLNCVTNLQVWIVAEFAGGNDTIALEADVDYNLALVHSNYGTVDHIVVTNFVQRAFVGLCLSLAALACVVVTIGVCFPIEVFQWSNISKICHTDN